MSRNLETLEEVGLIKHFHLGHGPGLYARLGAETQECLVCSIASMALCTTAFAWVLTRPVVEPI